jgi:hypothetical protein
VVTYLINSITNGYGFPENGDSAWIYNQAGVTDRADPSNTQDNMHSHRVPLEVIPGPIMWKITIRNNPFRGTGGGGNNNNKDMNITLSPNAKGDPMDLRVTITILNNMGNVVVDTTISQEAKPGQDNQVEYAWKGLNKKGRIVGTGTYLMKAVCVATREGKEERYDVQRSVGFVRGKNN